MASGRGPEVRQSVGDDDTSTEGRVRRAFLVDVDKEVFDNMGLGIVYRFHVLQQPRELEDDSKNG